jgi:hypothetical protein
VCAAPIGSSVQACVHIVCLPYPSGVYMLCISQTHVVLLAYTLPLLCTNPSPTIHEPCMCRMASVAVGCAYIGVSKVYALLAYIHVCIHVCTLLLLCCEVHHTLHHTFTGLPGETERHGGMCVSKVHIATYAATHVHLWGRCV